MSAQQTMVRIYDRVMKSSKQRRYYGGSGFYNFGYWATGAASQREASEALVDTLLARLPDKGGRILDVACGLGASTRRLLASYPPEAVTAINISAAQVATARQNAPGATVLQMDAAKLAFPDASFDAVICVEAAFHFDTRAAFLAEALRVLKPGGALVLSDILFRGFTAPVADRLGVPKANLVPDIASYRALFEAVGFQDVRVEDRTDDCLGGFRRSLVAWPASERGKGAMSLKSSLGTALVCRLIAGYFGAVSKAYLLVSARKP
ncbi:SAM-dependent methyltransferase [Mesorhizobium sp. M4A.F.Ca.ET.050.02.1.1]|uniref:class I SAM-dependent methyltransferase n=2 Tax=Mesorhizobium TaxID=68287 RepID=UPI000FC9B227|nr:MULTISPECIES: class I SAM-dependent methyltransferase [unclassified Mesorhizobium]RVD68520.1 SAM-dependent methyltransferase [Mesorhizobium sp. M4A.F.Ca.ET.029.04.2.1]RUX49650.1 SAM-dependent methyltransferase [Mesorhizobium sp. M4A.F.Ca.ET.050.02.1.1]RVC76705.1 SAM-dependent methyltransferase [Mesorhizobium sp. M4A.F.Ca.ET.022.05.2.1]RWC14709.1 MAG: SAM-dependent methyltransferase [Mesorhizobium sp.]RWD23738.1 MAG: SAM-dependent methyltransferase [Mesorhizobium sp.]